MHVVLCQPDIAWEDRETSRLRIEALLSDHRFPPGSLLVLPEMTTTGFSMKADLTVEPPGGETEDFFRHLAQIRQCCVLGGAIVHWNGAPRNQAIAIAPDGRVLARYSKQRPFTPSGESTTYPAGQETVVFDWGGFRIAPLICYDLRFPELFRSATAAGATLIAVIANWPNLRHHHWRTLLAARAIENQAAVVGVNRAGGDPNHAYAGGSQIIDAQGLVLAEADDQPQILETSLDPAAVASWRAAFPALRDAGLIDV